MSSISDFAEQTPDPQGSETKWDDPAEPQDTPSPGDPESKTVAPAEPAATPAPAAPPTTTAPVVDDILNTVLGRIGDVGDKAYFKLMLIGPPGQGKSSLILSARNALIYDFEDGLARAMHSPMGIGEGTKAIPYVNMDEFRTLVGALMVRNPALANFELFGVDTLSDLHKRDLSEITERDWKRQPSRNRYVPETEQYTEVNERIVRVVRALRDLPLNIVISSHSKTVEPKTGPEKTYADFSESLSNKVMAMMDMVGYLHMKVIDKQVVPVLRFKTEGTIRCKAPSFMPDEIVSPTYEQIRELWDANVAKAKN